MEFPRLPAISPTILPIPSRYTTTAVAPVTLRISNQATGHLKTTCFSNRVDRNGLLILKTALHRFHILAATMIGAMLIDRS